MLRVTSLLGILAIGILPTGAYADCSDQNITSDASKALSSYLAQREEWSTPQATDTSSALATYLAQRDTWNGSRSNDRALSAYLAQRASWATAEALDRHLAQRDSWNGSVSNDRALSQYLAQRASWGKAPKQASRSVPLTTASTGDSKQIERALKAYLTQRSKWAKNDRFATIAKAPKISEKKLARALEAYLAKRASWGTSPKSSRLATAGIRKGPSSDRIDRALKAYLAQRERWASSRDTSMSANLAKALKSYLARRDQWNLAAGKPSVAISIAEFCAHRVGSWGAVRFPSDGSRVDTDSAPTLSEVARTAKACPDLRVELVGHTDMSGNATSNHKLSLSRAKAIASYLMKAGVKPASIRAAGAGSNNPVAGNASAESREENRRVEFFIRSAKSGSAIAQTAALR